VDRQGDILSELPPKVLEAFEGRSWLGFGELCRALEMTPETMRKHVDKGNIDWRQNGVGEKHIVRVFSVYDVAKFWQFIKGRSATRCQ
jgi:hypothetical protein